MQAGTLLNCLGQTLFILFVYIFELCSSNGGAGVPEVISLEIQGEDVWRSKEKTGLEIQGEDEEREREQRSLICRERAVHYLALPVWRSA